MSARPVLLIAGVSSIIQPDALEDFDAAGSCESDVEFEVEGKTFTPAGANGEAIFRRAYIVGYSSVLVEFWFTPRVNGRLITALRTFCSKPAPTSGDVERFSFLVPLYKDSDEFPDVRVGLRGTSISAVIDLVDPRKRFYIEKCILAHEPVEVNRARSVTE